MKYYILSTNHTYSHDYVMTWWRPDNAGYTYGINMAGIYENENHYSKKSGDIMIPCDLIDALIEKMVYDNIVLNVIKNNRSNRMKLGIKMGVFQIRGSSNTERDFLPIEFIKAQYKKYKNIVESLGAEDTP